MSPCNTSVSAIFFLGDFVTLAPRVFGPSANVDEADFLATEILVCFGFVEGVEELRGMAARFLRVKDLAGVEGKDAVDNSLWETFFFGGELLGVVVSSSCSRACFRDAGSVRTADNGELCCCWLGGECDGVRIVASVMDVFFAAVLSGVFSLGLVVVSFAGVVRFKLALFDLRCYPPRSVWLDERHHIIHFRNGSLHGKCINRLFQPRHRCLPT